MINTWLTSLGPLEIICLVGWLTALLTAVILSADQFATAYLSRRRMRRADADVIRTVCGWGPERK